MALQESAALWQKAEMVGGAAEEVQRLVRRLATNLHFGYDAPEPEALAATPRRSGIDGYIEDVFDQISATRDQLQELLSFVGQAGNGIGYPSAQANVAKTDVVGTRRW